MKATLPAIAAQITAMINAAGIYTERPHHDLRNLERNLLQAQEFGRCLCSTYVKFEQAFGVSASLHIDPSIVTETKRDRTFKRLYLTLELNAPAMSCDIPTMNAKIALMRRVTDLASMIHAAFNGIEIEEAKA